jgi:glycosyltransferase involved in cell wall biosynthesis
MNFNQPQIIVAQLGAGRHYAVPVLLHRAGMLAHFYTDAYVGPGSPWRLLAVVARIIPDDWHRSSLRRLLTRSEPLIPAGRVTAFNLLGLFYSLAMKRSGNRDQLNKVQLEYGRRFCDLVSRNLIGGINGIFAFEGAALTLFRNTASLDVVKFLEKFIAPARVRYELLSEENIRWPDWETPYPPAGVLQERFALEQEEWGAADAIICPSEFVADGLTSLGAPEEKIQIVPYGLETERYAVKREQWQGQRPLHILFMGGVTLRKGPQYLDKALKQLSRSGFTARMVGSVAIREPYQRLLREQAELIGQVTRQEVLRHYAWADVLVFPTICEGSAMATYEALAAGLPVITTPNAGSVVRDGVDGFIVPIRDAEAIAAKLELWAGDPGLLAQMAENARTRAQEFSWERYGERLIGAIQHIVSQKVFQKEN